MPQVDTNLNRTTEDANREVGIDPVVMAGKPAPDVSIQVPNRGYGPRFGGTAMPDKEWGGKIPAFDSSIKGEGYYGMLPRKDKSGWKSSEISIGVEVNGKKYHVPSMVPGLTQGEIDYLLSTPEDQIFTASPDLMHKIQTKAENWAKYRIGKGLPVFATAPEEGAFQPIPDVTKR